MVELPERRWELIWMVFQCADLQRAQLLWVSGQPREFAGSLDAILDEMLNNMDVYAQPSEGNGVVFVNDDEASAFATFFTRLKGFAEACQREDLSGRIYVAGVDFESQEWLEIANAAHQFLKITTQCLPPRQLTTRDFL